AWAPSTPSAVAVALPAWLLAASQAVAPAPALRAWLRAPLQAVAWSLLPAAWSAQPQLEPMQAEAAAGPAGARSSPGDRRGHRYPARRRRLCRDPGPASIPPR